MFDYDFKTMAKKLIINLFPQDTRIVEIVSALALLFLSVIFPFTSCSDIPLFLYETKEFWMVVIFSVGFLQFTSLVLYPRLELLRCIMSWINGSFWVWISLSTTFYTVAPNDIAVFLLGLTNLYGFIININLLGGPWAQK